MRTLNTLRTSGTSRTRATLRTLRTGGASRTLRTGGTFRPTRRTGSTLRAGWPYRTGISLLTARSRHCTGWTGRTERTGGTGRPCYTSVGDLDRHHAIAVLDNIDRNGRRSDKVHLHHCDVIVLKLGHESPCAHSLIMTFQKLVGCITLKAAPPPRF